MAHFGSHSWALLRFLCASPRPCLLASMSTLLFITHFCALCSTIEPAPTRWPTHNLEPLASSPTSGHAELLDFATRRALRHMPGSGHPRNPVDAADVNRGTHSTPPTSIDFGEAVVGRRPFATPLMALIISPETTPMGMPGMRPPRFTHPQIDTTSPSRHQYSATEERRGGVDCRDIPDLSVAWSNEFSVSGRRVDTNPGRLTVRLPCLDFPFLSAPPYPSIPSPLSRHILCIVSLAAPRRHLPSCLSFRSGPSVPPASQHTDKPPSQNVAFYWRPPRYGLLRWSIVSPPRRTPPLPDANLIPGPGV
ncbi:hypothetical protein FA13DRAFT_1177170 [Coprinellus micaceus]|uniref:Uncharacterized protein n=1 Tax=Coprinellus micaceus TaxID=71717 RepID=A0A4Y7SUL2_COPMI|nr:hypothetical protein FA13DRAFT_1177170 [Coprinellus micaceus]